MISNRFGKWRSMTVYESARFSFQELPKSPLRRFVNIVPSLACSRLGGEKF
jgi:hypothetical protein